MKNKRIRNILISLSVTSLFLYFGLDLVLPEYNVELPKNLEIQVCDEVKEEVCTQSMGDISQESDNLYVTVDTGEYEGSVVLFAKYMFDESKVALKRVDVKDSVTFELEKDLDSGWLLGEYRIFILTPYSVDTISFNIIPRFKAEG